ncbi:MAG: hypothetical protein ACP5I6_07570 [Caldisphaera sp.]
MRSKTFVVYANFLALNKSINNIMKFKNLEQYIHTMVEELVMILQLYKRSVEFQELTKLI